LLLAEKLHESQKREIKNTFCFFYVAILLSRWRGLCANWTSSTLNSRTKNWNCLSSNLN
jgi:hypothetical protein